MSKLLTSALATGLISAILFLAVTFLQLGFFFMFLPTLPLLLKGLALSSRLALHSALAASLFIAMPTGLPLGILFLLFLGLPAWYFTRQAELWRPAAEEREWYPVGLALTHLALYACACVVVAGIYFVFNHESLSGLLAQQIRQAFAGLETQYGTAVEAFANHWSFLVFSVTIWLWIFAIYAHAWISQRVLMKQHRNRRPDLAITPFLPPNWLLGLLVLCALASLAGGETMQFMGKSLFIALLLPYFFLGAALMHQSTAKWASNRFFLFFVYTMIFTQFWPALVLALWGLSHHLKSLNKHLSSGGTSSSN